MRPPLYPIAVNFFCRYSAAYSSRFVAFFGVTMLTLCAMTVSVRHIMMLKTMLLLMFFDLFRIYI